MPRKQKFRDTPRALRQRRLRYINARLKRKGLRLCPHCLRRRGIKDFVKERGYCIACRRVLAVEWAARNRKRCALNSKTWRQEKKINVPFFHGRVRGSLPGEENRGTVRYIVRGFASAAGALSGIRYSARVRRRRGRSLLRKTDGGPREPGQAGSGKRLRERQRVRNFMEGQFPETRRQSGRVGEISRLAEIQAASSRIPLTFAPGAALLPSIQGASRGKAPRCRLACLRRFRAGRAGADSA